MGKVALIVAHPDDEVLGCGATIAKHTAHGDVVNLIVLADGETSRVREQRSIDLRKQGLDEAGKVLGIASVFRFDFPDNKMDSVSLLEIVQAIEEAIRQTKPTIIYTHHGGDLNIDHRITYQATMTACRPLPGSSINAIYCFEVPSSTEWTLTGQDAFRPIRVCDVSAYLDVKLSALKCYDKEMRPSPHARSYQAVECLAKTRGAQFGVEAAEVFSIERQFWR